MALGKPRAVIIGLGLAACIIHFVAFQPWLTDWSVSGHSVDSIDASTGKMIPAKPDVVRSYHWIGERPGKSTGYRILFDRWTLSWHLAAILCVTAGLAVAWRGKSART